MNTGHSSQLQSAVYVMLEGNCLLTHLSQLFLNMSDVVFSLLRPQNSPQKLANLDLETGTVMCFIVSHTTAASRPVFHWSGSPQIMKCFKILLNL